MPLAFLFFFFLYIRKPHCTGDVPSVQHFVQGENGGAPREKQDSLEATNRLPRSPWLVTVSDIYFFASLLTVLSMLGSDGLLFVKRVYKVRPADKHGRKRGKCRVARWV